MSDRLNVVALISGGKDSIFSLLHCIQNGHKVVALANLHPTISAERGSSSDAVNPSADLTGSKAIEGESKDLNSFMYQTVGHSLIPLYSTALQIPLYRRQISGSSIQQSQYYDTSSRHDFETQSPLDETEDLIPLLQEIISAHPEVNALSAGAILSTYQRTRVESVAIRLGLTPLSYLWQYPVLPPPCGGTDSTPQREIDRSDSLTGLLDDIASSGLDARIIKIASAGIPENLLFANVANTRTRSRLVNGLSPFFEDDDEIGLRGAVLGEGGEYETIALNGPEQVWRGGRIEIESATDQSYLLEGVSYCKIGAAKIVPHDEAVHESNASTAVQRPPGNLVPVLGPLDHQFNRVDAELKALDFDDEVGVPADSTPYTVQEQRYEHPRPSAQLSCTITPHAIAVSNLTSRSITEYTAATSAMEQDELSSNNSAAEQMQTIISRLPELFSRLSQTHSLPLLSVISVSSATILLRSISDFASVNPIYSQIYPVGLPNPPARVTIAAPLPQGIQVSLSLILDTCPRDLRRGLHVQGRSYWAPANIGPYSQAVAVPLQSRSIPPSAHNDEASLNAIDGMFHTKLEIVYIAGQIPLVPASMAVHLGSFFSTTILALQHLWRVAQERGVDVWPWGVAYLSQNDDADTKTRANIAGAVWERAHLTSTWTQPEEGDEEDDDADRESPDDEKSLDVWDMQRNRTLYEGFRRSNIGVGRHLHVLPKHTLFRELNGGRQKHVPPFIAAEVTALPRNVSVEWWSNGIAGFTATRSLQKGAEIEWTDRAFQWGSISALHIAPDSTIPGSKVVFISFMVDAEAWTEDSILPRMLPEVMHIITEGSKSKPVDIVAASHEAKIVQGTAFVRTSTLGSTLWSRYADPSQSTQTTSEKRSTQPNQSAATTSSSTSHAQSLPSQASIIPCHRLWGKAVRSTPSRRLKHTDEFTPVSDLAFTFLLRVNVDTTLAPAHQEVIYDESGLSDTSRC